MSPPRSKPTLLIVDDDPISRDILELLFTSEGYPVHTAPGGEAALEALATAPPPAIILTDLNMPGICGNPLAEALRALCPPATRILAMSGSRPPAASIDRFEVFLLKPFTPATLEAALEAVPQPSAAEPESDPSLLLDETIFRKFSASMPPAKVFELYAFCLDDADRRIGKIREHTLSGNDAAFRLEAHTIKGGCGMVGALELRRIAEMMETQGIPAGSEVDRQTPLDQFLTASARLRRMLNVRKMHPD